MAFTAAPGEQYTIRRKVFKILGAGFHIYDAEGNIAGYCKQKAFRLKEDLRVYTGESMTDELFRIGTTQVIDFAASYTVSLPTGERLGTFKRKGLRSLFKDAWLVSGPEGEPFAEIHEESAWKATIRRFADDWAFLLPQKFLLREIGSQDDPIATYRTHFNPFVHRLGVAIHRDDPRLDDLLVLAGGCLLAAIEGRQG
jgi:uncharacterized protein YxjI